MYHVKFEILIKKDRPMHVAKSARRHYVSERPSTAPSPLTASLRFNTLIAPPLSNQRFAARSHYVTVGPSSLPRVSSHAHWRIFFN